MTRSRRVAQILFCSAILLHGCVAAPGSGYAEDHYDARHVSSYIQCPLSPRGIAREVGPTEMYQSEFFDALSGSPARLSILDYQEIRVGCVIDAYNKEELSSFAANDALARYALAALSFLEAGCGIHPVQIVKDLSEIGEANLAIDRRSSAPGATRLPEATLLAARIAEWCELGAPVSARLAEKASLEGLYSADLYLQQIVRVGVVK